MIDPAILQGLLGGRLPVDNTVGMKAALPGLTPNVMPPAPVGPLAGKRLPALPGANFAQAMGAPQSIAQAKAQPTFPANPFMPAMGMG